MSDELAAGLDRPNTSSSGLSHRDLVHSENGVKPQHRLTGAPPGRSALSLIQAQWPMCRASTERNRGPPGNGRHEHRGDVIDC